MESKGTHTHERSRRARSVRRGVAAVGVATAGLLAWTLPSQAQDPEPAPTTSGVSAGVE